MTKSVFTLNDPLHASRESFDRIPVIDIAPLLDGSDPGRAAKEIGWALSNAGFMYVKNHGIAAATVDSAFAETLAFFDLPLAHKMALRGHLEIFGENTDPAKTRDLKECFDLGPERTGPAPSSSASGALCSG
jgi:isopenicillin N synthase-like dioxygenase